MRVSIAVPAVNELENFNICVWDMLRAIQRLVAIPNTSKEKLTYKVVFILRKEESWYNGGAFFCSMEDEKTPITLDPPFESPITWTPPKGCNFDESFDWLFTEVAKLAYAMTHGEVMPEFGMKDAMVRTADGALTMSFVHWGPDKTER